MPEFDLTLTLSTMEFPDRWSTYVHELGFFAFGQTEEEAEERVGDHLRAIAESFAGDMPGFQGYLDEHGVKYILLDDPDNLLLPSEPTMIDRIQDFLNQANTLRLHTYGKVEVPDGIAA